MTFCLFLSFSLLPHVWKPKAVVMVFQPTLNLLSVLCVSLEAHWIVSICTYIHPHTLSPPPVTHTHTFTLTFLFTIQLTSDALHQCHKCYLSNRTIFQCCRPPKYLKRNLSKSILKSWARGTCLSFRFIQGINRN